MSSSVLSRLSAREALFCIAYVRSVSLDVGEAAAAVGMTLSQGRRLMRENPDVALYIDELIRERAKRLLIDADVVVIELLEIAQAAKASGLYKEAMEALSLLGRHFKMFPDRESGGVGVGPSIVFNQQLSAGQGGGGSSVSSLGGSRRGLPSRDELAGPEDVIDASEAVSGCTDVPGGVCSSYDT